MTREELILILADLPKGAELTVEENGWGEYDLRVKYSVAGGTHSRPILKGK